MPVTLQSALVPALKLEGDVSGTLKLRSSSRDLEGLWRNAEAVLNTEITRGVLYGVHLGQAARRNGYPLRCAPERRNSIAYVRQAVSRPSRLFPKMCAWTPAWSTATGQFVAGMDGQCRGQHGGYVVNFGFKPECAGAYFRHTARPDCARPEVSGD